MNNVTQSLIATATIQLANIASGISLARILLPEGRGELAAAMLWPILIANLGILGIHEAVTYHAARRTHGNDAIATSSLVIGGGLAAVLVVAGWGIVEIALAGHRPETLRTAQLYLAFIPINFGSLFVVGLLQGGLHFTQWNILRVLVHVAYTTAIPVLYVAGETSITAFASASLLANGLTLAAGIVFVAGHGWLRPAPPTAIRDLVGYGTKTHLGTTVQILAEHLDQLVISVLLPAASFGLYVVALTLGRLATLPAIALAPLVFAKIARAASSDEQKEILGYFLRVTATLAAGALFTVVLFARSILSLFFGPLFEDADVIAKLLAVSGTLMTLKLVTASALKGANALGPVNRAETAGLVVSAVALAVLLPAFGLVGACLAAIASQLTALAVIASRVRRTFGVGFLSLFRPAPGDARRFVEVLARLRPRKQNGLQQ
jgi:O-antigen/teichoic acid export membrane protein